MSEEMQNWTIVNRNDKYFLQIYNSATAEKAELMLDENLVSNINKLKIVKPKNVLSTIILGFAAVLVFTLGLILSLVEQIF